MSSLSYARISAGKNEKKKKHRVRVTSREGNPRLRCLHARLNFFFLFFPVDFRAKERLLAVSTYTCSFLKEREANCSIVNKQRLCMSLTSSLLIYLKDSEYCGKFRRICIITGLRLVAKRSTLYLTSKVFLSVKSFSIYEVVRVSGILGTLNKPTTRNIRDAIDFVHAKRLAGKKCFTSRLSTLGNGSLVVEFVGKSGKRCCLLPCDPIKKIALNFALR